jgi:DNA mismatch endonuclease (patch repair protein)
MPRASTGPEVQLRRALHTAGLRYRVHDRALPGTPDIVFPRARLAIFIDGCFWHGCSEHGVLPKNNREWWREKLTINRERDQRKDEGLKSIGWLPLHFWEHEDVDAMVPVVVELWRQRTGRTSP